MLARRGFWWLVGAALGGLVPAILLAGLTVRTALESATLAALARDAASLAAAQPAALPAGAVLVAADGTRLGVDTSGDDGLPEALAAALARPMAAAPLQLRHPAGLLASHPAPIAYGTTGGSGVGAIALWQPAARLEARAAAILFHGLRDAVLLFALGLPACWIGARLLLAPLAAAATGGAILLDALRQADLAAESAAAPLEAATVLAAAPAEADPLVVAAAAAAACLLEQFDATEAALLRAATAEAVA